MFSYASFLDQELISYCLLDEYSSCSFWGSHSSAWTKELEAPLFQIGWDDIWQIRIDSRSRIFDLMSHILPWRNFMHLSAATCWVNTEHLPMMHTTVP